MTRCWSHSHVLAALRHGFVLSSILLWTGGRCDAACVAGWKPDGSSPAKPPEVLHARAPLSAGAARCRCRLQPGRLLVAGPKSFCATVWIARRCWPLVIPYAAGRHAPDLDVTTAPTVCVHSGCEVRPRYRSATMSSPEHAVALCMLPGLALLVWALHAASISAPHGPTALVCVLEPAVSSI